MPCATSGGVGQDDYVFTARETAAAVRLFSLNAIADPGLEDTAQ
jgi:hypothetical protein